MMTAPGDLTGAISEALAVIRSVQVGALTDLADKLKKAGAESATGGRTLTSSANEVGAQQGDPYVAYRERLTPVATWMTRFEQPATETATNVANAATVAQQAQDRARSLAASLSAPGNLATILTMEKQQQDALAELNGLIDKMRVAFGNIRPVDPGTAPVKNAGGGAGGGSTAQPASVTSGASGATAGTGADSGSGGADAGAAAAAGGAQAGVDPTAAGAVGPTSGPFNGWVQDPNSGHLVDPATGREVNAAGQFLDPVTGQPFGDATQAMSRLEGLQGGMGATGGLFGGVGGLGGLGATTGIGGGAGGGFAGLYGGMMPPSLMGSNPAMGQLQAKAGQNLQTKAETAQRYSALMTGQEQQQRPYMPPMGGGGGGAGGGGRAGRPSRRLVSEPSNVWGATGRGDRDGKKRSSGAATELVEDADVWTGGEQAGSGLLDR